MRKTLRLLAYLAIGLVLAAVVLFAYVSMSGLPNYQEEIAVRDISVAGTPEQVARGKALVVQACAGCHRGEHQEQFAGLRFVDEAAHATFGEVYVPNITQSEAHGIGLYTDGELYRLLRTGIKRNGEPLLPIMPRLPTTAEADILAMIAFLRSDDPAVQPVEKAHPPFEPSFLAKALLNFVVKPIPYQEVADQRPNLSDSLAYGAYLVNDAYGCYHCHSASLEEWNLLAPPQTPGYLAGGTAFQLAEYTVTAPGILPLDTAAVAEWTAEQFVDAVKFGIRPGQPAYRSPMHPYPYLDTAEVRTIYQYLHAVADQQRPQAMTE
jgi:mono/diheme cytochrome c family protein